MRREIKNKKNRKKSLGEVNSKGNSLPATRPASSSAPTPVIKMQPIEAATYKSSSKSVLTEDDKKIIRGAIYVGSAILVGGTTYILIRRSVRKKKAGKAEKVSLTDNTPQNFAKRLIMAFDNDGWWGTDVEAVRKVFVQLPSQDFFKEVIAQYKILKEGKSDLIPDLTSELTTTEYYEMQSILASKPQKTGGIIPNQDAVRARMYARRLNSAVNYKVMGMPATDEDAIRAALTEIPSQRMWVYTKLMYEHDYGLKLENELDGDLGIFDFSWRDIIKKKPV